MTDRDDKKTDDRSKRDLGRTPEPSGDGASGEDGGGTVMVWDRGTYRNLRARKGPDSLDMEGSLRGGQIEVWLEGTKLRGGYVLKRSEGGDNARWLLIKMDDEGAEDGDGEGG